MKKQLVFLGHLTMSGKQKRSYEPLRADLILVRQQLLRKKGSNHASNIYQHHFERLTQNMNMFPLLIVDKFIQIG